jgi:hypothetical protein
MQRLMRTKQWNDFVGSVCTSFLQTSLRVNFLCIPNRLPRTPASERKFALRAGQRYNNSDDPVQSRSLRYNSISSKWFSVGAVRNAKLTKAILQMRTLFRFAAGAAVALTMSFAGFPQHYKQTDLVSNTSGSAPVVDPQLINAWGLSRGPGSAWWVSDNLTGVSTLYDGEGDKQSLVVTIPPADPTNKNTPKGSPTGTIFNGSQTDFLLAPGKPAVFLFCTADGTVAGWNPTVERPLLPRRAGASKNASRIAR